MGVTEEQAERLIESNIKLEQTMRELLEALNKLSSVADEQLKDFKY